MAIQRYAHQDDFARVAECFGGAELQLQLGVNQRTLRRWRSGATRIPWAAYRLAFELSWYGRAERDARENFSRYCLTMALEASRRRVAELDGLLVHQARLVAWGCANDPWIWPTDPRSALYAAAGSNSVTP